MTTLLSRNTYKRGYIPLGSRPTGKFLTYLICALMLTSSIQVPLVFATEYLTQETTPTPELIQEVPKEFPETVSTEEILEEKEAGSIIEVAPEGTFAPFNITVSDSNMQMIGDFRNFSVSLTDPNDSVTSILWSVQDPFITISNPTSLNIVVEGIVDGSTLIFADVQTALGGSYRFERRLNIYNLIAERPHGFANRNTQFYDAAHPTGNVRSPAPQNITFSVIATTGRDYFLVSPVATDPTFVFADGIAWDNAWIPSAHVTIPTTGITLSETSINLEANQTRQLQATVTPSIASDRRVRWTSSNPDNATVSNTGLVTARRTGSATITATTVCGNRTATANVTIDVPVAPSPAAPRVPNINISVVLTGRRSDGRGQNDIRFRAVEGAVRYRICRRTTNGSFTNRLTINRARTGNITFSDRAVLGRRYVYRVRAYDSNERLIARGRRVVTTGRVQNLRAEAQTQTSIRLRWNRVLGAQSYRIYRADSSGPMRHIRTVRGNNTTSFTDRNLRSNRSYRYRVRAVRDNLRNNTFPQSPRVRERTMTLRQSTRAFMERYRGVRVGPNRVDRMSMADRRVVIANRTVLTADQGRIRPPVKYHFNRVSNTLEIHLFVRYRTNTTPTQGIYLSHNYPSAQRFRAGVNRFFDNRLMEVPGRYRYRTRVVWHDRPSRWVNEPNRPERNQRYFTIYLGGVCGGVAPNVCSDGRAGSNWYHARMRGPLSGQTHTFMPARAQVLTNSCGTGRWLGSLSHSAYVDWYRDTAAHEMGHMLGLGDGYFDGDRGGVRMTKNHETSRLSGRRWTNMMYNPSHINRALPNDMEMILRAYSEDVWGRRHHQFYRTHNDPLSGYPENPISPEIRDRVCQVRPR